MSEITSPSQNEKSHFFKRIIGLLIRPRQFFALDPGSWRFPMLVLNLTLTLQTVVAGFLRAKAAALGEMPLPQDWQWWTPEMQNNYMQAQQATQEQFLFTSFRWWAR